MSGKSEGSSGSSVLSNSDTLFDTIVVNEHNVAGDDEDDFDRGCARDASVNLRAVTQRDRTRQSAPVEVCGSRKPHVFISASISSMDSDSNGVA